jgi:phosphatidylserine decarboxylase
MRIAPEGWVVIIPFCLIVLALPVVAGVVLALLGMSGLMAAVAGPLGFVSLLLIVWCFWFFRDPERVVPAGENLLISPADGKVIIVDQAPMPKELQGGEVSGQPVPRIAIFLNVFNVHVNRVPASGTIEKVVYTPGQFLTASLDKASTDNERSTVLMRDTAGRRIGFAQIAGLVARRIVNHLKPGQQVTIGERFGLIRFGSRAELFLPPGTAISVKVGEKVIAGETVLAVLPTSAAGATVAGGQAVMAGAR